jgi:hypothetical protein
MPRPAGSIRTKPPADELSFTDEAISLKRCSDQAAASHCCLERISKFVYISVHLLRMACLTLHQVSMTSKQKARRWNVLCCEPNLPSLTMMGDMHINAYTGPLALMHTKKVKHRKVKQAVQPSKLSSGVFDLAAAFSLLW